MIVITQETMGQLRFPAAYGSLLFVEALGVILGSPLVGWTVDWTQTYNLSLYISGALLILSGRNNNNNNNYNNTIKTINLAAILMILPSLRRWRWDMWPHVTSRDPRWPGVTSSPVLLRNRFSLLPIFAPFFWNCVSQSTCIRYSLYASPPVYFLHATY